MEDSAKELETISNFPLKEKKALRKNLQRALTLRILGYRKLLHKQTCSHPGGLADTKQHPTQKPKVVQQLGSEELLCALS